MKVILANISGFCDGVKRAMRIALAASEKGGLWADGPLVHNEQAIRFMSLRGVAVSDKPAPGDDKVLVRAHGVEPERRLAWKKMGLTPVDATCVHVARNQRLASDAGEKGAAVVLAGDPDHAEARAVMGSAGPKGRIVSSVEDVERLQIDSDILFLAQTTFNVELFHNIAAAMRHRFPRCRVVDTICRATHDRQAEAARIAALADALVVVGGRHSANTRRLADTGRAQGKPVFLVETADELHDSDFASFRVVAVTSGASTPGWITQEVVNRLRRMGRPTIGAWAQRLLHSVVESRLSTALSAGGFALASQFAISGRFFPDLALAGAAYAFFAHTLNRRIPPDPRAREMSPIDSFYRERRSPLLLVAWFAAGLCLFLALPYGAAIFGLFCSAIALTVAYAWLSHRPGARSLLAHIPAPGSWAMASGWALVLAGPPVLEAGWSRIGAGALAFVLLVCFGGSLIRDLHDIASDGLMGIDTLPARLGLPPVRRLATTSMAFAMGLSLAAAVSDMYAGGGGRFFFFLLLPAVPLLGLFLLDRMERHRLPDAVLLQAGVNGLGCLAGILAICTGVLQ